MHRPLMLVVFGHIHAGYGSHMLPFDRVQESYEKVLLTERRFWAVFVLGFWVLWRFWKGMVWIPQGVRQNSDVQVTRLVIAAIACGLGSRSQLVFQI